MTKRLRGFTAVLIASVALSGCWVFDEMDSGMEKIDKYAASNAGRSKSKDAAKPEVAAHEDSVDEYFRKENEAGTTRTISPGQVSEGIVKCRLGGATQFMTKDACAARGGLEGA